MSEWYAIANVTPKATYSNKCCIQCGIRHLNLTCVFCVLLACPIPRGNLNSDRPYLHSLYEMKMTEFCELLRRHGNPDGDILHCDIGLERCATLRIPRLHAPMHRSNRWGDRGNKSQFLGSPIVTTLESNGQDSCSAVHAAGHYGAVPEAGFPTLVCASRTQASSSGDAIGFPCSAQARQTAMASGFPWASIA